MSEVTIRRMEYDRIEISGVNGEQEKAYQYLDKNYPDCKQVMSSDSEKFHIVAKAHEKRIDQKSFVI